MFQCKHPKKSFEVSSVFSWMKKDRSLSVFAFKYLSFNFLFMGNLLNLMELIFNPFSILIAPFLLRLTNNIAGLVRMGLESLVLKGSDVKYKSYKYKSFVIMSIIITFNNWFMRRRDCGVKVLYIYCYVNWPVK